MQQSEWVLTGNSDLDQLPYAINAPFNAYAKQNSPTCLPHTRIDLLQEIHGWADGQDERCIFWLNGLAGTGKSTIARTVSREYYDQKRLGASFFFSRGGGDVGRAEKFVTSIAVQLGNSVRGLRRHISDAIADNSDSATRSLGDQWQLLVFNPLSKLEGESNSPCSYTLVVDALDECEDDDNVRIVLQLLIQARSLTKIRLRIFLTSRPELPIRHSFQQFSTTDYSTIILHNISPSIVDHDISIFLARNLEVIGQENGQDTGWPGPEIIRTLVQRAGGLFIWAATACRFIREGLFADERLRTLLVEQTSATALPEEHLNEIYITVLRNSIQPSFSEQDKTRFYGMLRAILGTVVVLLSPLTVGSLSRLLSVPKPRVNRILDDLHAILDIPLDDSHALRLHHPSFHDFLLDKNRCGDGNFCVDEKQAQQKLADNCLQLMSTSLKEDICLLGAPGVSVPDMDRVEQYVTPELQYASLYWVYHLQSTGIRLHDNDKVHQFLQVHLLHWFEVLSLIRRLPDGVRMVTALEFMAVSTLVK